MEKLPRDGHLSRSGLALRPRAEGPHPCRAGQPPSQEARGRRGGHHRCRRPAPDRHPGRPFGRGRRLELSDSEESGPPVAQHCPECGFVNAEGANYCQRCGAFLAVPAESTREPSTATYRVGETGELIPVELDAVVSEGAALVI